MPADHLLEAHLTKSVVGALFEVYNILGFGFLEHLCVQALEHELRLRGHDVKREVAVAVAYKGVQLSEQRMDMIVDDRLIVEVKSTAHLHPVALRQLYNYLKASRIELGLLLHFGPKAKFYRQILTNDRKGLVHGFDGFDGLGTEPREGLGFTDATD